MRLVEHREGAERRRVVRRAEQRDRRADLVTVAKGADDASFEVDDDEERARRRRVALVPEPIAVSDRPIDLQDRLDHKRFRAARRRSTGGLRNRRRRGGGGPEWLDDFLRDHPHRRAARRVGIGHFIIRRQDGCERQSGERTGLALVRHRGWGADERIGIGSVNCCFCSASRFLGILRARGCQHKNGKRGRCQWRVQSAGQDETSRRSFHVPCMAV
jgi:hypothetical protein